jgi:peptide deformylase
MALRTILKYPDKRLRAPGRAVTAFDGELETLLADMAETMYAAPGVGLAATQIGVGHRVFVLDLQPADDEAKGTGLMIFINPEIVERRGEIVWEEGCLSFPGIHEDIHRDAWVKVRSLDREGKPFEVETDGLYAVAIQHEIDHLDGVLLVDRVSLLKRRLIHRKMMKWHQNTAREQAQSQEEQGSGRPAL